MKIIWSPLAAREAHDIAAYIAKDRPQAALSWLNGAFESVERLKQFPESGRAIGGVTGVAHREIVYGKAYRIIYRAGESAITIIAVRNFAQQLNLKELGIEE